MAIGSLLVADSEMPLTAASAATRRAVAAI